MKNPSYALAWSALSLSWPALLSQIAGVVSIVFLIDLAMNAGEDSLSLFHAAEFTIIAGLVFFYSMVLHKSHTIARTSTSLGFPYRAEFSLPVSTRTLLLTPLLVYSAFILVAVFVPMTIINLLFFNVEVSVFSISFMIFQFTILILMLTWWTDNAIANVAGWLIALILYINGFLMPEFTRVENAWVFVVENPTDYFVSLFFTATLFALTHFGVRQQRSGEAIIGFGNNMFNSSEQGSIRDILHLPISDCPTKSPMAAEFWKEQQLHGVYSALFGGLTAAFITFAILATINFFVGNGPEPKNAWFLILPLYGAMCIGLTIYMYGVRFKNGAPTVSLHDRTIPLSTAKLTLIRTSVSLSSTLLAGVIMFATIGILGPFLISNYQNMQTEFLQYFTYFDGLGFTDLALIIFLSLVAFLTWLLLLATFFTWTMLHNKAFAIVVATVPVYIFLWSISLLMIYGDGDAGAYNQAIDSVLANHLWVLVLLIPVGLVITLRDILHDQVLSSPQMLYLIALGIVLEGLNLTWLLAENHFDVLGRDIWMAQLSYLVIQGLLPLLAAILALWTSNRVRHG